MENVESQNLSFLIHTMMYGVGLHITIRAYSIQNK